MLTLALNSGCAYIQARRAASIAVDSLSCALRMCLYIEHVFGWLHTQNIHATFELQGLFDNELGLLGKVCHQALHGGGIDILLNNHLYFLCDRLDLNYGKRRY